MAEPKLRPTDQSVTALLDKISDEGRVERNATPCSA